MIITATITATIIIITRATTVITRIKTIIAGITAAIIGMTNKAVIIIEMTAGGSTIGIGTTATATTRVGIMGATEITAITMRAGISAGIGIIAMIAGSGMTFSKAVIVAIVATNSACLRKEQSGEASIVRVPERAGTGKTAAAAAAVPYKGLPGVDSDKA